MPNDAAKLYQDVCRWARRTAVMTSIEELLGWDERTQMPSAGAEHRAEQSTLLAGLIHQRWVDPKFGGQLEELAGSAAGRRSARRRGRRGAPAETAVRQEGQAAADAGGRTGADGRSGPAGLARGPRKGRFPLVSPVAGEDDRVEARAGRGAGLSAVPLRRPAGRLRAGGADGQRGPGVGRAARGIGAVGGGNPAQPPPAEHRAARTAVSPSKCRSGSDARRPRRLGSISRGDGST